MTPFAIALIVFSCSFIAALVGMALYVRLPERHLNAESRDLVKLVMGLIATMSALVLSLLIASANTSRDQQISQLKVLSVNLILFDRTLELYGPDAKAVRDGLHEVVWQTHDLIWSRDGVRPENLNAPETQSSAKANVEGIQKLSPKTGDERTMKSQAMREAESLSQTRLLMFMELGGSISWPFLTVLVFWISMLFLGFGLCARFNGTVTVALFVGAISVAGAVFLVLELNDPYRGLMRISDEPLRRAMAQMDPQREIALDQSGSKLWTR